MIVRIRAYIIDKLFWYHNALADYYGKQTKRYFAEYQNQVEIMRRYNDAYVKITSIKD